MTMPNVVVGDDKREYWEDDNGLFAADFKECGPHGWRDAYVGCPWPNCKTSPRWPLLVTYRCSGLGRVLDGGVDYDLLQFGEKATYIAEKRGDRYVWVKYAPVEEGDLGR